MGGAFEAVETLKSRLVSSMAQRTRRIESGEQTVVGVNEFRETTDSPLGGEGAILKVDHAVEAESVADVAAWRAARDQPAVDAALAALRAAAEGDHNVMPASIALARAGGTTGEWGNLMREVYGEFRAPTGVAGATGSAAGLGGVVEFRQVDGGRPAEVPRCQARPRRTLERRRANRGCGARLGHGGRLLRDSAHTRTDRRVGSR